MNKILAIKGDKERGNEVIALLEMLGGDNRWKASGNIENMYYSISNGVILYGQQLEKGTVVFTLDKFYEKYPFKVGDFVRIPEYESEVRICDMDWTYEGMQYLVYRNDDAEWYTADELLEYNDNPNKTRDCKKCGLHFGSVRCFDKDCPHNTPKSYAVSLVGDKVIDNLTYKDIDMNTCKAPAREAHKKVAYISINDEDYADQIEINLGDNYEYKFEMNRLYIFKKKPKYPETYKECCDALNLTWNNCFVMFDIDHNGLTDEENNLYESLIKLKRCRDAYWKIAGEKMGLDKPWEPNWSDTNEEVYGIQLYDADRIYHESASFTFPSEEILNEFCKNFKELIEQCKELL